MKNKQIVWGLFILITLFIACEKSDPFIPNEEELITTVRYILTPDNGGTPITLSFEDLDGEGGNAPTISSGVLAANMAYSGTLELLNEAENPAENVTEEIEEEKEAHQFFYSNNGLSLTINYSDEDANGQPVGLTTTLTTGDASSGNLTITLRHEPDKNANGVANGLIENAGGETDIEVVFPITIQ